MIGTYKGYQLDAPISFWNATQQYRDEIANGVGPEWAPAIIRRACSSKWFLYGISALPATDIHDWEYDRGTNMVDKMVADKRFGDNLIRMIRQKNRWWTPWNWIASPFRLRRTLSMYLAVRYGGDDAFWEGKERPTA